MSRRQRKKNLDVVRFICACMENIIIAATILYFLSVNVINNAPLSASYKNVHIHTRARARAHAHTHTRAWTHTHTRTHLSRSSLGFY